MREVVCTNCRRPYPEASIPYRCPVCGGLFDSLSLPPYQPELVTERFPEFQGIWRFRHVFGLPATAPVVSLGEGNTPLVWASALGRQVAFKLESTNPTGSYKDRGSAVLFSFLKDRGTATVVEDSSGNAGASCAAYAAAAGIASRIFIPDSASGPKRAQIEAYGAEIVRIMGPRSNAAEAVRRAADQGTVYASHAYLPFGLPGYATLAFELVEQIGIVPGTVIAPVGQGNLLLAIGRGFLSMQAAGLIERIPTLVGVQARACAPLWALFSYGAAGLQWVTEAPTLAEGVRVKHPMRGDALLQMVESNDGLFVAVDEEHILPGRDQLASLGLYVEPTSALVWNALEQVVGQVPEPLAVVLTGSGLKTSYT